ncbi:MAG: class GN sortase [Burkholderiales bacterium]
MKTFSPDTYGDIPLGVECALPRQYLLQAMEKKNFFHWAYKAILIAAFSLGAWHVGYATYIYAKAELAQVLIARAWERTLKGEQQVKPWSWADTWPVARLKVPGTNIDLYILAGASGRTIAFGPGHMSGTPLPGASGNSVIGGHRDTHLAFLRDLAPGQDLVVQRPDGSTIAYRVQGSKVVHKSDLSVIASDGDTSLTLITCYPFDALRAGGAERYVVSARSIPSG